MKADDIDGHIQDSGRPGHDHTRCPWTGEAASEKVAQGQLRGHPRSPDGELGLRSLGPSNHLKTLSLGIK